MISRTFVDFQRIFRPDFLENKQQQAQNEGNPLFQFFFFFSNEIISHFFPRDAHFGAACINLALSLNHPRLLLIHGVRLNRLESFYIHYYYSAMYTGVAAFLIHSAARTNTLVITRDNDKTNSVTHSRAR